MTRNFLTSKLKQRAQQTRISIANIKVRMIHQQKDFVGNNKFF
jgi:hypothetical protein